VKRCRTWLLLAALIGVALAVYFEPSHCVRGWLWGEAFFEGRPTSYWRGVLDHDLQDDPDIILGNKPPPPPTWFQGWVNTVVAPKRDWSLELLQDSEARGVLHGLADDQDPDVSGFAKDALQRHPIPADFMKIRSWVRLLCKHHRDPQARALVLN
jgi:hypothetical protein